MKPNDLKSDAKVPLVGSFSSLSLVQILFINKSVFLKKNI